MATLENLTELRTELRAEFQDKLDQLTTKLTVEFHTKVETLSLQLRDLSVRQDYRNINKPELPPKTKAVRTKKQSAPSDSSSVTEDVTDTASNLPTSTPALTARKVRTNLMLTMRGHVNTHGKNGLLHFFTNETEVNETLNDPSIDVNLDDQQKLQAALDLLWNKYKNRTESNEIKNKINAIKNVDIEKVETDLAATNNASSTNGKKPTTRQRTANKKETLPSAQSPMPPPVDVTMKDVFNTLNELQTPPPLSELPSVQSAQPSVQSAQQTTKPKVVRKKKVTTDE